jgi:tRNA(Ile)-lysidine synthase
LRLAVLSKARKIIEEYRMLDQGERVVAAVSGGPDSVALLKVLAIVAGDYKLSLLVAHLNHGLRGKESDSEEAFVRSLCRDVGVECISKKLDVSLLKEGRGKSLEDLCRNERYAFLKQTAEDYRATKIALGHHLHDQAETVLMNFLRGSGTEGLRGILPVREGMFIRPLLKVTRNEILAFLKKEGLTYVNDSSNLEDFCLRNRIRHKLIPLLKEGYNPRLEETLSSTAEIMRLDDEYMELEADALFRRCGIFEGRLEKAILINDLLELHEALRRRVIKKLLTGLLPSGKAIGFKHVMEVADLAQKREGSGSLDLPGGMTVRREYDMLIVSRKAGFDKVHGRRLLSAANQEKSQFSYPVEIPGCVNVAEAGMAMTFQFADKQMPSSYISGTKRIVYMDYEALQPPLAVRNAKPGDKMQPLGMAGTKKLKSFFIDEKIPRRQRDKIPLLIDRQSILWVAGIRMSERARITDRTRRVLKIEIV